MKYRIITLIGLAGSTLAVCLGGWDKFLQTLLLFMAIDWFTGGILLPAVFGKSPKSENGALESRAGWKGLCRKGMTLLYVLIAADRNHDRDSGSSHDQPGACQKSGFPESWNQ